MSIFWAEEKAVAGGDGADEVDRFVIADAVSTIRYNGADKGKAGSGGDGAGVRDIFILGIFTETCAGGLFSLKSASRIEFEIIDAAVTISGLAGVVSITFNGSDE